MIPREVEDGLIEQPCVDEHQDVEHSTGAAVAVMKWVDGLELIVRDGHPDQGVKVVVRVDEALPGRELVEDEVAAFGGCIDDAVGNGVGDTRPRDSAHQHLSAVQGRANLGRCGSGQGPVLDRLDADEQGLPVAVGLLGRLITIAELGVPEQGVARGDDVLDLRTRLRFEQREAAEQHAWVRQQASGLRQRRERCPSLDGRLQDPLRFEVETLGWHWRQVVVGNLGNVAHMSAPSTCRRNALKIEGKPNAYAVQSGMPPRPRHRLGHRGRPRGKPVLRSALRGRAPRDVLICRPA